MLTLMIVVAVAALLCAIGGLMNKVPLSVAVLLLAVFACLQVIPLK